MANVVKYNPAFAASQRLKNTKKTLPRLIGNQAKNFFLESFRKGGFTDIAFVPWQEPKRKQVAEGGTAYKYKGYQPKGSEAKSSKKGFSKADRTRATLVQSGQLRDSIHVQTATPSEIVISANTKYAATHNYGLPAGKSGKRMPKRKFLGDSLTLRRKLKGIISTQIKKALLG